MVDKTEVANPMGESFKVEHDIKSRLISAIDRLAATAGKTEDTKGADSEGS